MTALADGDRPVRGTDNADWWRSFHVPEMADLFLVRDDEDDLAATIEFLTTRLKLKRGALVYDQCCGIGSLSIALASQGMKAIGSDLCDFFIERAIRDATEAGVDCEFFCDDAFLFVPDRPCDAAFNWYSSFGYAETDERNRQMLQRAFEALRPGGCFALDIPNFPGVLRGFQRHLVRRGISGGRHVTLIRESEIDLCRGRLEQLWTWIVEGRSSVERRSSLRLYLPHQVREMLEQCGFQDVRFYGDVQGEPFAVDSSRLLLVATRPTT